MARAPTRSKDDDEDDTDVMTKAIRTRTKEDEEDEVEEKDAEVEPHLASDVAPGFTPGAIPGAGSISAIKTDTATYGTETPPRQTPPTSKDYGIKHSPPTNKDSNGAVIASLAPTLTSISPNTAVAITGADLTMTCTGTNFDRATFIFWNGAPENTIFVSATSLTTIVKPSTASGPGVSQVTVKNPAGESVQRAFTFT